MAFRVAFVVQARLAHTRVSHSVLMAMPCQAYRAAPVREHQYATRSDYLGGSLHAANVFLANENHLGTQASAPC